MTNPIMNIDPNGNSPEWWQWTVSGLAFVGGIACVATGFGGPLGGTLICASVNSIIGSYSSESTGGSSFAGWIGGAVTGTLCSVGAGLSGSLLLSATKSVGISGLAYLSASFDVAFMSGFAGSFVGQWVSSLIDGREINWEDVISSSYITGLVNCISGIGAGMGGAIIGMPDISSTTKAAANTLNTVVTIVSEAVCDFLTTLSSIFI